MPIHAILGATGNTGSAVLCSLLGSDIEDLTINILVRSKAKLYTAFPKLEKVKRPAVNIFEGTISNEANLASCLRGASVIYMCISTNYAVHKVDVAFSAAAHVVTALGQIRKSLGPEFKTPVIVFNRSMSMNTDVKLPGPDFVKTFFSWLIVTVYDDLERALVLYDVAAKDELLTIINVDGPTLTEGEEPTGYELLQSGMTSMFLSYADLGKAMVEISQRRQEFNGQAVAVSATGKVKPSYGYSLGIIMTGFRYRLFPF